MAHNCHDKLIFITAKSFSPSFYHVTRPTPLQARNALREPIQQGGESTALLKKCSAQTADSRSQTERTSASRVEKACLHSPTSAHHAHPTPFRANSQTACMDTQSVLFAEKGKLAGFNTTELFLLPTALLMRKWIAVGKMLWFELNLRNSLLFYKF